MVLLSGYLEYHPEERDEVIAGLAEVTRRSRQDAGCVEYWWAEDVEAPNTFRFFECWESQALFDAHIGAPHELAFGERYLARITGATATVFEATVVG